MPVNCSARSMLKHFLCLLAMVLAAALPPRPALAGLKQAPASRITLELPDGYEPSGLFSGFINEALGVSLVVVEMPEKAYEALAAGMTQEALAAKGILNARRSTLARANPHVYMQAEQTSAAGSFAKFFVAFREGSLTALVTANVQKASLEKGQIKVEDIETMLASARVVETPAPSQELFRLSYLGEFKPAGRFLGTARIYTLDGDQVPKERAAGRPLLIVAPSLDRRPVTKLEDYATSLLNGLPGLAGIKVAGQRLVTVAGLSGIEITGTARDQESGAELTVYQMLLIGTQGGYYRIVGQAGAADSDRHLAEFRRIAETFELLP